MKKIFLINILFIFFLYSFGFAINNKEFETDVKNTLNSLIEFYSNKDIDNLIALIDLNFSDSQGRSCADLAASFRQDFRSFQNINLYITGIKEQIISNNASEIVLVAEWNRAMSVADTAQVWMLRGLTNLTFKKDKDGKIKLLKMSGDLFFALADFKGIITLSSGTLDNQPITNARQVTEGRFIN